MAASNQVIACRPERCFRILNKIFHSGSEAAQGSIALLLDAASTTADIRQMPLLTAGLYSVPGIKPLF